MTGHKSEPTDMPRDGAALSEWTRRREEAERRQPKYTPPQEPGEFAHVSDPERTCNAKV